jgi:antitoxin YefM
MTAITASEARKNLFPLIERVNADRAPVEITSRHGNAVLLAKPEYDALIETAHLLRAPANVERLLESAAQAKRNEQSGHLLSR